jgi:hypothetical protein
VGRVPPDHLGVVLAIPGGAGEAALGRRHVAGQLHGGQVWGKHYAAFEHGGERIGAAGKIGGGRGAPKVRPMPRDEFKIACGGGAFFAREVHRQLEHAPAGLGADEKRVRRAGQRRGGATQVHSIGQIGHAALDAGGVDQFGAVGIGPRPVVARGVVDPEIVARREGQADAQHAIGDEVWGLMTEDLAVEQNNLYVAFQSSKVDELDDGTSIQSTARAMAVALVNDGPVTVLLEI